MTHSTNFKIFPYAEDSTDPDAYHNMAARRYKEFLRKTGHTFCYIDIAVNNTPRGRVVIELYTDIAPHACENFRHLCLGDIAPVSKNDGKIIHLHYKNCTFFRIVKGGWIQSGDIENNKGSGGYSIYGPTFPDESFSVEHDAEGIVGYANTGPNTNASQFYITTAQNSWMNKRYVAFGCVIDGLSIVRDIHQLETHYNQKPKVPVVITDCGQLDVN
jgi:cyclophilin family peptidyl-prolyl cis-trans isomerase